MTADVIVKERPILFSGEMVRAILDGRKTQTRRIIKKQPLCNGHLIRGFEYLEGDRLWVKEALYASLQSCGETGYYLAKYVADGKFACMENVPVAWQWKRTYQPGMFMPRWASRITLGITGVRVERLQEITPANCKAEGIFITHPEKPTIDEALHHMRLYRDAFTELWDSLNAKRGYPWDSNPWVWVIEFKRITP